MGFQTMLDPNSLNRAVRPIFKITVLSGPSFLGNRSTTEPSSSVVRSAKDKTKHIPPNSEAPKMGRRSARDSEV